MPLINTAPTLTGLAPSVTFLENTVNATPQLLYAAAVFADAEGNFDGGTLRLTGLQTEDRASVRDQGTGVGQIGLVGGDVSFGGVTIGTLSGGVGNELSITFNANATSGAVGALIQNLTYANVSDAPTASRDLLLNVTDAAGASLAPAPGPAAFAQLTGAANPLNTINSGFSGAPSFVDLDGDGDLDLVLGDYFGTLRVFDNTAAGFVELTGAANPMIGIDVGRYSAPTFVDLDGDSDLDLVVGNSNGPLRVFDNADASFVELTGPDNPLSGVDVGRYSAPTFVDLDGDGDLDLVVGNSNGPLRVFDNADAGFVELTGPDNPLSGVDVGQYSAPTFVDLDGDGDLDLVVGSFNGTLQAFNNTNTGFVELTGSNNALRDINSGYFRPPTFVDLDGDGDLDLVVGSNYGTLTTFQNTTPRGQSITVAVTAEAEVPVVTGLPTDVTVLEDVASDLDLSAVNISDADTTGAIAVVLTASAGTMTAADAGGVVVTGTGMAEITLTGTAAAIDAYLNNAGAISYTGAPDASGDNAATIQISATNASGGTTGIQTVAVDITGVNDAPVVQNPNPLVSGGYTEGAPAIQVTNGDAVISDVDSATMESMTIFSAGTYTPGYRLEADTTGTALTKEDVSFDVATGSLTVTGTASVADYQTILNSITLFTDGDDPTAGGTNNQIRFDAIVNDGQSTSDAQRMSDIPLASVNDTPLVTATGRTVDFVEDGAPATLFTNTAASTVEALQTFSELSLTVTGLVDGVNEQLLIDGTNLVLVDGNSGTTAANGLTYVVTVAGGTATVALTGGSLDTATLETLLDTLSYLHTREDPTAGSRTVTLTGARDSGGTENGGDDTVDLSIATTINVIRVDDAPFLIATAVNPGFVEGAAPSDLFNSVLAQTVDTTEQSFTGLTLTVANLADGGAEVLRIDGTDIALIDGSEVTTATNGLAVGVTITGSTATVSFAGATLSEVQIQELVDGLAYSNTSIDPTIGLARVVTLAEIMDSGNSTGTNANTSNPNIQSSVSLIDVNSPPTLTLANTVTSLPEDADTTVRLKVGDIVVADDAPGTNVLALSGADAALFEIDGMELFLRAGTALDFETLDQLDVTVSVDDADLGSGTEDSAALSIAIADVNEAPTLTLANTVTSLPEDADTTARLKVGDIVVADDAPGTNVLALSGADAALFEIDGMELFLRAGTALDFETLDQLDVTVSVDDADLGSGTEDSAALSIAIADVNEAPTLTLANTVTSLPEDADTTARLKVGDIVVADDAPGTNVLALSGADAALFEIDGMELFLRAGTALDFETLDQLDVTVSVDDADLGSGSEDSAALSIAIADVNEAPTLTLANTVTSLPEDADTTARLKVGDIVVADDAPGTNVLALSGADAALFEIDGMELFLRAGTALDSETLDQLDVTVSVDDADLGSGSEDSAALSIAIADVNEAPTLTLANTVTSLPEDADTTARLKVGDIVVADDAPGTNVLALSGADAALFEIDGMELFLRAGTALDFETLDQLDVTVSVDDADLGSGSEDSAALSIAIADVNEAPTLTLANTVTSLPEDADTTARLKVGDIVVADDAPGTNVLALSGADAALFEIDGMELFLRAGTALDSETLDQLDVTVSVDDADLGSGSEDSAALSIAIADVNEAPTLTLANTVTSLPEDADTTARLKVGDIVVADDAPGTNVLALSGADAALFEINGMELFLRAGTALDFETLDQLDVTVSVDDADLGSGSEDSAALSIAIADVNEAPTPTGTQDQDALRGDHLDNVISGFGGDDTLSGGFGNDTIAGGDGNDIVIGEGDDDSLGGGVGQDTVSGGTGNDTIGGGEDSDIISGGAGSDYIAGDGGDDTIGGGTGNDTIGGSVGNDILFGGAGNDVISAGAGADVLTGGLDDDTLSGNVGADTLGGGAGNDVIGAGAGADLVHGGSGNDILAGGLGTDTIYGGDNDDLVYGGGGDDIVLGGAGADTLIGGAGNDLLSGGFGADVFVFRSNAGDDTISDFQDGLDQIVLRGATTETLSITENVDGALISFSATTVLLQNIQASDLNADDFLFL